MGTVKKSDMSRRAVFATLAVCLLAVCVLAGCAQAGKPAEIVDTITTELGCYHAMSDGTWSVDERSYQYRLELRGRMPNAARETTFVYLSNLESITFEQAWKAAGLSSQRADYFAPEEAVLVEILLHE